MEGGRERGREEGGGKRGREEEGEGQGEKVSMNIKNPTEGSQPSLWLPLLVGCCPVSLSVNLQQHLWLHRSEQSCTANIYGKIRIPVL